jgi:hypothetical protein
MASKSKRARQAEAIAQTKSAWPVILTALVAALVGYLQNRYGQFSDIRGFYGTRFMNGNHNWPYNTFAGANGVQFNPVEYPVVTGIGIWILTFVTPQTGYAFLNYFGINVVINALLFAGTTYYIKKLTDNKTAYIFSLAPAVFMALNLNWDIWAVFPMVVSIYYFEKENWAKSAILLGVSIATKFFPIVLLIPIFIVLYKTRELKKGIYYFTVVCLTWLSLNIPVMITSFDGWKYFYTFSFNRGLGDGSIYSILSKLGLSNTYSNLVFYTLNLVLFGITFTIILRNTNKLNLSLTAYFAVFCFTFFGKQYSMQYVLWLAPLALILIGKLPRDSRNKAIFLYLIWQVFELGFRLTYFQNAVTNVSIVKGLNIIYPVSDKYFAVIGTLRYAAIFVFFISLLNELKKFGTIQNKIEVGIKQQNEM